MFEIKLETYYKDGREVETTASAEHFAAWEEHFDKSIGQVNERIRFVYYLAWLTSPQGLDHKEWLSSVRDVDPVKEDTVPFLPATRTDGG